MQARRYIVAGSSIALAPVMCAAHAGGSLAAGPFSVMSLSTSGDSLEWRDINGDGLDDLLTRTQSTLRVQLMAADRTVASDAELENLDAGGWLSSLAVYADLDGDGVADIARLGDGAANTIEVRFGNGAGDWGAATVYPVDASPRSSTMLAATDADADGDLDLYVDAWDTAPRVLLFRNDGSGGFGTHEDTGATGISTAGFEFAHLNGDAFPDLISVQSDSAIVDIMINDGTGLAASESEWTVGFSAQGSGTDRIATGDLDGDGDTDIAIANNRHSNVSILINDGAGDFTDGGLIDGAYWNGFVTTGDVDADGDLDLIAAGPGQSATGPMISELLRNNGDATFAHESWFDANRNGIIAPVDIDGDGDLDLLYEQDGICVVVNDGGLPDRPEFLSTRNWCCGTATLVSGDLNGDGLIDIVTDDHFQNLNVSFQQPDGSFSGNFQIARDSIHRVEAVGDIDGDGDLDIVGNYQGLRTFANNGDGTFGTIRTFSATAAPPKYLADMDGDGDLDSVGFSNDFITIMRNSGTGTFVEVYAEPVTHIGIGVAQVAVFDADGDGRLDIARWFSDGTTTFIGVRLNIGTWTFTPEVVSEAGILPIDRVAVADLDGDGALDAVTLGFESQTGAVLRNTGAGSFAIDRVFPNHGMRFSPALADFDGDGDLDYAGINFEETRVIVLNNRGGGDFGDPVLIPSGQSGRGLIARDMNADGAIDLVSDYNSGGQFSGGASVVRYGVAPDAPGCNPADLAEPFGVLDLADISDFLGAFTTGGTPADLAEPFGVLDLADISAFVTAFVTGCP